MVYIYDGQDVVTDLEKWVCVYVIIYNYID